MLGSPSKSVIVIPGCPYSPRYSQKSKPTLRTMKTKFVPSFYKSLAKSSPPPPALRFQQYTKNLPLNYRANLHWKIIDEIECDLPFGINARIQIGPSGYQIAYTTRPRVRRSLQRRQDVLSSGDCQARYHHCQAQRAGWRFRSNLHSLYLRCPRPKRTSLRGG